MADHQVIERLRKLMRMATHKASNPQEAAQAMKLAQKLMHEHSLDPSVLDEGPKTSAVYDPTDEWKLMCYRAAAELYGALIVRDRAGRFVIVGRDHVREAVNETGEYLIGCVERWYQLSRKRGLSKSERSVYRRDFRDAMSKVMFARAVEMSASDLPDAPTSNALVVRSEVQQRKQEATDHYRSKSTSLVLRPLNVKPRMSAGSMDGLAAGDAVALKRELG